MGHQALHLEEDSEVVTHMPTDKERHMIMNYVNCHNCTADELVQDLEVPGLMPKREMRAILRSLSKELMYRHVGGKNILVEAASVPKDQRQFYSPGIGVGLGHWA